MFGPPPATRFDVAPTPEEIAFFKANGFLAVERLTSDEEVAWLRQIFEYIFDPANAGKPGGPVDRSGVRIPEVMGKLTQSFFPEIQFPEILQSSFRRNAKKYAAALLDVAADRCVWGSDWPHVGFWGPMPNVGALLDVLADWATDTSVRNAILVDNPHALYGFGART